MSNDKLKIYVTSKDDSSKRISLSPIEELSFDNSPTVDRDILFEESSFEVTNTLSLFLFIKCAHFCDLIKF